MQNDPTMTDEIWKRNEIESPCKKICVIHPQSGICIGCFRTRNEIGGWSLMSPEDRRALMDILPDREPLLSKGGRRGGRKRTTTDRTIDETD